MRLYDQILMQARKKQATVAFGVGQEREDYCVKSLEAAEKASDYADVVLVGKQYCLPRKKGVVLTTDPEKTLVELLRTGKTAAAVRGTLSATKTITELKKHFNVSTVMRIALLETSYGHCFFFAPVGIDDCRTFEEKVMFIKEGSKLAKRLGIKPKIAILSGGRLEDRGRDPVVDRSLDDAEKVVERSRELGVPVQHSQILIEDAVAQKANFILAPDGISGNLIFRTLCFLGGGRAYGAPVVGLERPFVDTSRAQSVGDYILAIALASALTDFNFVAGKSPNWNPDSI